MMFAGTRKAVAELTGRTKRFDVDAEIKKQFPDLLPSPVSSNKPRDRHAEYHDILMFGGESNSADIKVIYWQAPRFPKIRETMQLAAMLLGRSQKARRFFDGLQSRQAFKLHKRITGELHENVGLTWEVSIETGFMQVAIRNDPTAWRIAIEKERFPGQNIPRIAFRREVPDWREAPERLQQRLNRAQAVPKMDVP